MIFASVCMGRREPPEMRRGLLNCAIGLLIALLAASSL
jgi:hypothetical protein